jgi:RES domain-containing protein
VADPARRWRRALAGIAPIRLAGRRWYRLVSARYREALSSERGAYLAGGRYNPPEQFGALYLGESPGVCRVELARQDLRSLSRFVLGTFRVTLAKVCDLTDPAVLRALGIKRNDLVQDDWLPTQQLGTLIREAGFEAALVPSAAGPHVNLVIFTDRLSDESEVRIEDVQDAEPAT